MTLTARDRKLLAILLVVAALAGYWFLVLGPKRQQAQEAAQQLTRQEQRRDAALATLARLESARTSFEADYATIVRLGKAVPADVDVPSLMVQLEDAADRASIEFDSIVVGERTSAPAPATSSPGTEPPAAPGGEPAETVPGQATESAGEVADDGTLDGPSATPAGQSTATSPGAEPGSNPAPSLETVPLEFSFEGDFFDLADLFHELKRYVDVDGKRIDVEGRLLTVDSLSLVPSEKGEELVAEIGATAYVAPGAQGATGGATPGGPTATGPAASPADDDSPPPPSAAGTAPTAGATP